MTRKMQRGPSYLSVGICRKAQGLEYDSVKVVIPSVNTEKITKGVFYTAITRTKKKLTIYWSSETMEAIISGFSSDIVDLRAYK